MTVDGTSSGSVAGQQVSSAVAGQAARGAGLSRVEVVLAVAAFALLCVAVLSVAPQLVEPDDYAYRGSILAITQGHVLTPVHRPGPGPGRAAGPRRSRPGSRWSRRRPRGHGPVAVGATAGRALDQREGPGYPFLAAPFQALGLIRLAPLFYGALACLGLFAGGRRWLGRFGGAAAVGLFCSSGAALLFAWRDYMPTFTDASLIAAGTGALLWALLAEEGAARRRTWIGLAGFVAIEAAVFVRYTNLAILACAVAAVLIARRLRAGSVPRGALRWWLGSVALSGAGVAIFDDLVYGGPVTSGYRPGEVIFSLGAVLPNLRYMPSHLIRAMPMLVLGLAGLAWIGGRWARLRHADGERGRAARRDFAVSLALVASWASVWALYAAYSWTASPGLSTLQATRFYVPALGAISLLAAWPVVAVARRAPLAAAASAAAVVAIFGLGLWSFHTMLNPQHPGPVPSPHCNIGQPHCPS